MYLGNFIYKESVPSFGERGFLTYSFWRYFLRFIKNVCSATLIHPTLNSNK